MKKFFIGCTCATAFMAGWGIAQSNWVFVFIEAVISICCLIFATHADKQK